MGKFLTDKSRIGQTAIEGIWYTLDNQLYKDDDGCIYLAPRHTLTDGYTIPEIFAPIVGGKLKHDIRCSIQHDWECYYHKVIQVNLTEYELKKHRFLHSKDDMMVCEDIPLQLLTIRDTTFRETNSRFMRMLLSISNISKSLAKIIGLAVNFNVNWLFSKHILYTDRIYRIDYDQIKGVMS